MMTRTYALPNASRKGMTALPGVLGLQRKCACGGQAGMDGACDECRKQRLQARLAVGSSQDPLEREADRVADQVLGAPTPVAGSGPVSIQRLDAGNASGRAGFAPRSVDRVIASPGAPLSAPFRRDMERRFGYDFSRVRVHTESDAARSAQDVRAQAYTVGNHIVFAPGRYDTGSPAGRRLMAHELTHVVQQAGGQGTGARVQRHKDDLVAYTGGQSGLLQVVKAGRWVYSSRAVSGHAGHGENEPNVGPIPSGRYVIHPGVTRAAVASLQSGVCGARGISSGYQKITSTDPSPCSGAHYCNVPCPTTDDPGRTCFTPKDCWGSQRIKIEGSKAVDTPEGKHKVRSGFYIHAGNPADAVSSGCVKTLDEGVFDPIRTLTGLKGAVPFCVGATCEAAVNRAFAATAVEAVTDMVDRVKEVLP